LAPKNRIHLLLEGTWHEDRWGRALNLFLIVLIALNVLAVLLESVETLALRHAAAFQMFEIFSVAVFTVEYGLRLWTCTEDPRWRGARPLVARLRYAATPMAIFDLLAFLPFYLAMVVTIDLRFLRVFRLLRILKLTRYSPAAETLAAVVNNERRALFSALVLMLTLLTIASSLMYMIEKETQPEAFASIPAAMWWGMATLTTVGYGDVTPVTPLGKLLGGVIALLGIGMFALPAGILASGFAQEIKKRDFIVSWNLVAKVALFAELSASQIAEVAALLGGRLAAPGEVIFREGDPADNVYFIVSGEIQGMTAGHSFQLGAGDFFGEIALLHAGRRTATVTASTTCQLLVLDRREFSRLLGRDEGIRATVSRVAGERLQQLRGSDPNAPRAPDDTG